jgi:transketolase
MFMPKIGQGNIIRTGNDVTFIVLGPVLLNEVLKSAKSLHDDFAISCKIISTPWANRFDKEWFEKEVSDNSKIIIIENHYVDGGFGEKFSKFIKENKIAQLSELYFLGIFEIPKCGTNIEILTAHNLDHKSITLFVKGIHE